MEAYTRDNWSACGSSGCPDFYHYADIAIERDAYDPAETGARSFDIVGAINAAILVLQDKRTSAEFVICDKAEAVLLLAHFVGDVHQPLHVGAVYLRNNEPFDPDISGGASEESKTDGGNKLYDEIAGVDLHSEWDSIDASLSSAHIDKMLLDEARSTPVTAGPIETWAAAWATDTLQSAKIAYGAGLHYSSRSSDDKHPWNITFDDRDSYATFRSTTQRHEIAKAGARLAQLLNSLLNSATPAPAQLGYLTRAELARQAASIPPRPSETSPILASDALAILSTRWLIGTERGEEAHQDDVYQPVDVTGRFSSATGKVLNQSTAPTLMKLLGKVESDSEALLAPVKSPVCAGGRRRPILEYRDLVNQANLINKNDQPFCSTDGFPQLPGTGSYPSGHATIGTLWAGILTEILPERAPGILKRGYEFGESRVVCGFHYPSDVQAGRVAATGLLLRLHADKAFLNDLAKAKEEVTRVPDTPLSRDFR